MARSRKWRKYRGWIAGAVLLAIAGTTFMVLRSARAAEQPTTTYSTSAAEKGTLQVTVSGTGNLELADTTEVWPETAGTVASVEVKEGQSVKAGQVLFTLDDDDASAAIEKASASYAQAKAQVAQATAQVTKAQSALDKLEDQAAEPTSTVSDADVAAAKADVTSAKASLASAKAQRSTSLSDYNDAVAARDELEVTAPVSGKVYSLDIEQGDPVSTSSGGNSSSTTSSTSGTGGSSAPVTIASTKPLVATLSVNEVDLPSLKVGQRVDLEFDALPDLALTGKVTDIADEGTVDQGVVSFDISLALDVANKQLKPGMSVAATIVTAVARDALLVPNAAVKSDDNGSYVQVLGSPNGQPQRVDVEVGMAGDTQTQVLSGLSEGDEVVTATNDASDSATGGGATNRAGIGGGPMVFGGGPGR